MHLVGFIIRNLSRCTVSHESQIQHRKLCYMSRTVFVFVNLQNKTAVHILLYAVAMFAYRIDDGGFIWAVTYQSLRCHKPENLQDKFSELRESRIWRLALFPTHLHLYVCNRFSGESNGNLPLRTCPGCSVPEPYRSPDWFLVPAKPA